MDPIVSVCVVAYNNAPFVKDCIQSILMQNTNFSFEIIIGEDDSTDDTRKICQELFRESPDKIRLFLRDRKDVIVINGKPTGRFNFSECIKSARGKYIAICDGDDFWCDELKLQKQFDILEKNRDLICVHSWQKMMVRDGSGSFIYVNAPKDGHGYLNKEVSGVGEIFANRMRPKSRTIFFRNIFKKNEFPSWYYKVQFGDEALNFILGKFGDFYFIDEELAVYRITNTGASSVFLSQDGHILGVKSWILLWNYAFLFYNKEHMQDAAIGMAFFLKRTLRKKEISRISKVKLILWFVFISKTNFSLRAKTIIQLFL